MTHYDVFNGDADGICALHQLRLAEPRDSVLITGVKRDISLVKRIDTDKADSATVLDISMDKNREALEQVLGANVSVFYADHHFPGDIPENALLDAHIDTDANICTGLIVNRYLKGEHLPWAITAAYGDNLHDAAKAVAAPLGIDKAALALLEELGTLLNYNGYGSALEDLYFTPDELYKKVSPYENPFDFISNDKAFITLKQGYASDMDRATAITPELDTPDCAMFVFPDDPFSRRVSGVYSNQLARENPERAHALASTLPDGNYLVSVRAPLANTAAGINQLPPQELDNFSNAFVAQFS